MTVSHFSANFPFTPQASTEIDEYDIDEITNKLILKRAVGRIKSGVEDSNIESIDDAESSVSYNASKYTKAEIDLLSYSAARILISLVNDNRVISRYCAAEAARSRRILEKQPDDVLQDICDALDLPVTLYESLSDCQLLKQHIIDNISDKEEFAAFCDSVGLLEHETEKVVENWSGGTKYDVEAFLSVFQTSDKGVKTTYQGLSSIPLTEYVELSQFTTDENYKSSNQIIIDGVVLLSQSQLFDLLQTQFNQQIKSGLPVPVPDWLAEDDEIIRAVDVLTTTINEDYFSIEVDEVSENLFPPCMELLLEEISEGVNLDHNARFAIASFLVNLGMSNEEIVEMFGMSPEFTPDATEYQLNHIRGDVGNTEYTSPSCDTMVRDGLCRNKDKLCEKISHPLSYYQVKYLSKEDTDSDDESDEE